MVEKFQITETPRHARTTRSIDDYADLIQQSIDLANPTETLKKVREAYAQEAGISELVKEIDPSDEEQMREIYFECEQMIREVLPPTFDLQEVSELKSERWRGIDPINTFSFLSDSDNVLKISSRFYNVANHWETSLGYGVNTSGSLKWPFALALGFRVPKQDWAIKERKAMDPKKDVFEIVDGKLRFSDIEGIVLRLKSPTKGKTLPPKFYKIIKKPNQLN